MTRLRLLAAAVAVPAVLLGAGCTSSDPATGTDDTSSPASTDAPSAPTPAGGAEAEALAALPEGPATGTAVLAYSGVGEVRAPFVGECSRDGDVTRLDGAADTAQIRLEVAPAGVRLTLDDVGLSATSELATGRYDVAGNHLSLSAALLADGRTIGHLDLEIDCDR